MTVHVVVYRFGAKTYAPVFTERVAADRYAFDCKRLLGVLAQVIPATIDAAKLPDEATDYKRPNGAC